jgi:hypothetical protein
LHLSQIFLTLGLTFIELSRSARRPRHGWPRTAGGVDGGFGLD